MRYYDQNSGASYYDAAGRLTQYHYQQVALGETGGPPGTFTHTYATSYAGRDSWLETTVTGSSSNSNYQAGSTVSSYDAYGRRTQLRETSTVTGSDDTLRLFAYSGAGQILFRREGTTDTGFTQSTKVAPSDHFTAAGNYLGEITHDGDIHFAGQLTGFASGQSNQRLTVQAGDTLKSIAQRVYGNASYWYVIADANGINPGDELATGSTLNTPEITNHHNDAATFKPYQPGELIGSTSPNLPYVVPPPSDHGCSKIVQIIMVVVMVVATIYTAGAASAAAGGGWAGALAAGATTTGMNVASQAVNVATGLQDEIDYGQALQAGVTAGVTAGLSDMVNTAANADKANKGLQTLDAILQSGAGQAAASYLVNYAAGKAINPDDTHFSLRSLAATTAGAWLGDQLTGALGLPAAYQPGSAGAYLDATKFNWASVAQQSLSSIINRAAGYAANHAFGVEDHWNGAFEFADAFGNALGSAALAHDKWLKQWDSMDSTERQTYRDARDAGQGHTEALARATYLDRLGQTFKDDMASSLRNGDVYAALSGGPGERVDSYQAYDPFDLDPVPNQSLEEVIVWLEANERLQNLDKVAEERRALLVEQQRMYKTQVVAGYMGPATMAIADIMDITSLNQAGLFKKAALLATQQKLLSKEGIAALADYLGSDRDGLQALGDLGATVTVSGVESAYDFGEFQDQLLAQSREIFANGWKGFEETTLALRQFDADLANNRIGVNELAKMILEERHVYRLDQAKSKISMIRLSATAAAVKSYAVYQDFEADYSMLGSANGGISDEGYRQYKGSPPYGDISTRMANGLNEIELYMSDYQSNFNMTYDIAGYEDYGSLVELHHQIAQSYETYIRPYQQVIQNYDWGFSNEGE